MDKFLGVSEIDKESEVQKVSPERNEPKRKCVKSIVWNYFKRLESGSAKCLTCGHVYKSCGNTTNLFNHLKRAHPTVLIVPKVGATIADFFDTNAWLIPEIFAGQGSYFDDRYRPTAFQDCGGRRIPQFCLLSRPAIHFTQQEDIK
ncbi:uncharacterized protein [Drosophila bipectinata]|uniref:uncharacterized protein n=1 Tax=Drosophila bipectinata TaxID=42026 RepID=UPI0038B3C81D